MFEIELGAIDLVRAARPDDRALAAADAGLAVGEEMAEDELAAGGEPVPPFPDEPWVAAASLSKSWRIWMVSCNVFIDVSSETIWFGSIGLSGSCACNCAVNSVMKALGPSSLSD